MEPNRFSGKFDTAGKLWIGAFIIVSTKLK